MIIPLYYNNVMYFIGFSNLSNKLNDTLKKEHDILKKNSSDSTDYDSSEKSVKEKPKVFNKNINKTKNKKYSNSLRKDDNNSISCDPSEESIKEKAIIKKNNPSHHDYSDEDCIVSTEDEVTLPNQNKSVKQKKLSKKLTKNKNTLKKNNNNSTHDDSSEESTEESNKNKITLEKDDNDSSEEPSKYQAFISKEIKRQREKQPGLKCRDYMSLAAKEWNKYKIKNNITIGGSKKAPAAKGKATKGNEKNGINIK